MVPSVEGETVALALAVPCTGVVVVAGDLRVVNSQARRMDIREYFP